MPPTYFLFFFFGARVEGEGARQKLAAAGGVAGGSLQLDFLLRPQLCNRGARVQKPWAWAGDFLANAPASLWRTLSGAGGGESGESHPSCAVLPGRAVRLARSEPAQHLTDGAAPDLPETHPLGCLVSFWPS